MRTVCGIPECSLPNGRRFAATVTYTCEDEDAPYVETSFVDIAPGRVDVLLRPHEAFTTVFSIRVTAEGQHTFPRIRAWFAMIRGRPFSVPRDDVSIHETCMNLRVRGYFDARFQIRFNESEIAEATAQFAIRDETTCATADGPRSTHATNNAVNRSRVQVG
jgi:hypothetical protein